MTDKTVNKMQRWEEVYYTVKVQAIKGKLRNTLIALETAVKYHEGTFRDGGEPYIIHPLMVAKTLMLLKLEEELAGWFPHMDKNEIRYQCDILYAAALLHDVLEDCYVTPFQLKKLRLENAVIQDVKILSKKRKTRSEMLFWKLLERVLGKKRLYNEDKYFTRILENWRTTLIKIADRENNCSTMEVFKEKRLRKYVCETKVRFYDLCKQAKVKYPELTNVIEIMRNSIVAEVEIVATLLNMQNVIADEDEGYEGTFKFIEEYSRNQMPNTHKALYIARDYYKGKKRSSGDPFIIHPLRATSYLINLRLDDDILCAGMLLHGLPEIYDFEEIGEQLKVTYNLSQEVIEIVKKIPKPKDVFLDNYYAELEKDWRTILGRGGNRAHTCTKLAKISYEEKREYIKETREYLVPMLEYAVTRYPQFVNQIDIMEHHVTTICNIVEALVKKQSNSIQGAK